MTRRIFLSILLVTLIALFLSTGFLSAILFPYFETKLSNELIKELNYLAPGTTKSGISYLQSVSSQDNRITLLSSDGTILYDNAPADNNAPVSPDSEEIQNAIAGNSSCSIQQLNIFGKKALNCAVQLENGSILRLSGTQYSIVAVLLSLIQPILVVLFFTVILSGIFAYRLSQKLTQPLNEIDLENPLPGKAPYEELKPLLRRLHYQNTQINVQMEQLRSQQQQFTAITQNMQEGLLVLDPDGNILSFNSSTSALLNTSCSLSGANAYTLSSDEDFHHTLHQALSGQHGESLIYVNGRVCRLFANPVCQDRIIKGAVLVLLDVTEQHQREALRREFSANVSHELKTPLTSISGIAEIMSSDLMEPADVPQFAKKIYTESQRLIKLVQDILRISQLDENTFPQQAEPIDLFAAVQSVCARLDSLCVSQNIKLSAQGEPAYISAVYSVLDEMIFNLCENAIKYNVPGGSVLIRVHLQDNSAILSVRDTGIGIPAEHQSRVFERFYRVDKSHSRAIGGTGLGLSIVKHGALLHHAQLQLESIQNEGTTVTLSFPIAENTF